MLHERINLRRIGKGLSTGGLSEVLPIEEPDPQQPERDKSKFERFSEILATGGYCLLERAVERPPEPTNIDQ